MQGENDLEFARGEAQARLAAIVESSDDAIVSKTLDGVIMTWNTGAERIFGYTPEEAIGKPILLIIPDDRKDEEPRIGGEVTEPVFVAIWRSGSVPLHAGSPGP